MNIRKTQTPELRHLYSNSYHDKLTILKRLVNRWDDYAMQTSNGRYKRVGDPVTDKALEAHLEGLHTIGSYQMDNEGYVSWICFDIDSHENCHHLNREAYMSAMLISNMLNSEGIGHLCE